MTAWISVKDRLPEETQYVLVVVHDTFFDLPSTVRAAMLTNRGWRTLFEHKCLRGEVTHWMPLPEPPEKGGDE